MKNYAVAVYRDNILSTMHIYDDRKKAEKHFKVVSDDKQFGLTAKFMDSVIVDFGQKELKKEIEKYIVNAYKEGLNAMEIARIFKCSQSKVLAAIYQSKKERKL